MNFQKTTELVHKILEGKQDPDKITFIKQWDETGQLKGFMVTCEWDGGQVFQIDSTDHYCREIGNLDDIPDYVEGKHQVT